MIKKRRILVVTPTLNSGKFLEETLRSVAGQRGDLVIHHHVQDGVSTDRTLDILREWEHVLENGRLFEGAAEIHFSWASEKDGSMYDSLNKGFAKLLSDVPPEEVALMTWINSDDLLASGSAWTALSAHLETGYEVITGLASVILESGVKASTLPYSPLARSNVRKGLHDGRTLRFIMQEGTYWTPGLWNKCGGLDSSLRLAGDWDLWRRFAEHAEWLGLKVVLAYHRRHDLQLSHDHGKYWAEVDRVMAACRISDAEADAFDLGHGAQIVIETKRWEVRKQEAGTYAAKNKKTGWNIKFSSLGHPVTNHIGLSYTEHWGRWSDANVYDRVILALAFELPASFELSFTATGFCGNETFIDVDVLAGDSRQTVRLGYEPETHVLQFTAGKPSRFITFIPRNPSSPAELWSKDDHRKLGVGLRTLAVRDLDPSA